MEYGDVVKISPADFGDFAEKLCVNLHSGWLIANS
jgi:hypothetical protein